MGTRAPLPSRRRAGKELAAQRCCLRFLPVKRLRPPLLLPGPSARGGQRPRTREASPATRAPPSWAGTPPTPKQRGLLGAPHLHTHNRGCPPVGRAPGAVASIRGTAWGRAAGDSPRTAGSLKQLPTNASMRGMCHATCGVASDPNRSLGSQTGPCSTRGCQEPRPQGPPACRPPGVLLDAASPMPVHGGSRPQLSLGQQGSPRQERGPHGTFQEASARPDCAGK